jgi:hypothetical protein
MATTTGQAPSRFTSVRVRLEKVADDWKVSGFVTQSGLGAG